MSITIGNIATRNRVFLAPMSGVSDEPFRALAHANGAGLVVSEMVASEELVKNRKDMVRRASGAGKIRPLAIQLAGREARWMTEGARIAQDLGADIIDINMGCPAREVTGGLSGSALMRNIDHAVELIEATVEASRVPVTVKMRLGWDFGTINAPALARRAENAGVSMVTVHGRTRCQFYGGSADWKAVKSVKQSVRIPVIVNGDCRDLASASRMMAESEADGLMIGRGSYGRPWWPGVIAEALESGTGVAKPTLARELELLEWHLEMMWSHYGHEQGNRIARKHLGWAIDRKVEEGRLHAATGKTWRNRIMSLTENGRVRTALRQFFGSLHDQRTLAA